jgi:hypothetical protein
VKPSALSVAKDWVMLLTGVAGFLWEIYSGHADPVIVAGCLTWAGVPAALAVFQGKLTSALPTHTTDGLSPPPSPPSSSVSSSSSGDSL